MPRIFISYSRKNEQFARRLASDLDRLGADVWLDVDDIPAGMKWSTAVQQGLDSCEVMIVIISPESMGSTNVEDEWQAYLDDKKPVIPLLWQPARVHFQLRRIQYVDFHAQKYDAAFAQLHAELGRWGISLKPLMAQDASVPIPEQPVPESHSSRVLDLLPPPFEWIDIPVGRVQLGDVGFNVPAFTMAKYPLTNAQYARFIEAGGYRESKWWTVAGWDARGQGRTWNPDKRELEPTGTPWAEPRYWHEPKWTEADYPVVGVSWYEAVAFCQWLSEVSGEPVMLPTEQQWQRAAQGDDDRKFPWGDWFDASRCNTRESKIGHTTPVTQYPDGASPFGVMDMAGNVWEWCLTEFESGGTMLEGASRRVLRGGSWYSDQVVARAAFRMVRYPNDGDKVDGFRIVSFPIVPTEDGSR